MSEAVNRDVINTECVIIAAGLGSFQPRRLMVPDAERFEGRQVHYRVRRAEDFHGRDLLIAGGGDSALDWTLDFCGKARSIALVHRRAEFRAQPASVARMKELVAAGRLRHLVGAQGQVTRHLRTRNGLHEALDDAVLEGVKADDGEPPAR